MRSCALLFVLDMFGVPARNDRFHDTGFVNYFHGDVLKNNLTASWIRHHKRPKIAWRKVDALVLHSAAGLWFICLKSDPFKKAYTFPDHALETGQRGPSGR